jgi:mannose-6-phosphate isomerase-like protein (cupin superfamily)
MKHNLSKGRKIRLREETIYETRLKNSKIGVSIAEIGCSEKHAHKKTNEWYFVLSGKGFLYLNGKKIFLKKDDFVFIPPKLNHFAKKKGKEKLKVLAITMPPWSKKDHFLA